MSSLFLLDDALNSVAVPSRRNELFMTYILETQQLPGVDDDIVGLPNIEDPMSPQIFTTTGPRHVDGAHESHQVPGYQPTLEGWGSDNAAMKILASEGSKGDDPSMREEGYFDSEHYVVFHSQCLEYLCKNGPNFLMGNLKAKERSFNILLNMADNVKVITPADEPLSWDILNMSLWKVSLCELIKEMKTVEKNFPSLIYDCGVYVLTTSPYGAFLRALASEIADVKSVRACREITVLMS